MGDALNALRIFNEKGVDEITVLDIEAGPNGSGPNLPRIRELAQECFAPLAYGGGVTDLGAIERLVHAGVEKVILNTASVENPSFLEEAAREFGTSTMVAAIDYRNEDGAPMVYTRGGSRPTTRQAHELAKELCDRGAGEILLQSIDRDGTRAGYDLDVISSVSKGVNVSVVACGGANDVNDLRLVLEMGCSAAAGSMFVLFGRLQAVLITYPRASELGRQEDVWP